MEGNYSDEVTLDDVLRSVQWFFRSAFRRWYIFVVAFVVIGGYMFYSAMTEPVTFDAKITVMREEEDPNAVSGVSSIIGQFGFGRRSSFNLDRLLELSKSRKIVTAMLFDSAMVNGTDDFLANHLIEVYELDQRWVEVNPDFDGFRFIHSKVDSFTILELSGLKRVHKFVVGNESRDGITTANYSELSSIVSLTASTINEQLSIQVINILFDKLAAYYINNATKKQLRTYRVVKKKADSIGAELLERETEYAQFRDANQNLYSNLARLKEQRLFRDITRLNVVYSEALKNLEIADFTLKNATPVITELDRPVPPLQASRPDYVKLAFIASLLTLLAGVAWIGGEWLWGYSRTME